MMTTDVTTETSEIRTDRLTGIRVIVAQGRDKRPTDLVIPEILSGSSSCDFCPSHEAETPNEIWRWPYGKLGDPWRVRVIPNKFAAMRIEGRPEPDQDHLVNYRIVNTRGAHELIIMTPNHTATPTQLGAEQYTIILEALVEREAQLYRGLPEVQYIQPFFNYGHEAGASLGHLHLQLICIPINPIIEVILKAMQYMEEHQRSIFDKILEEAGVKDKIVFAGGYEHFVGFCPYASWQPFMIRIMPKIKLANLDQARPHLSELAQILNECLLRLEKALGKLPPLNIAFHEIPYRWSDAESYFRFWIDIIPRINQTAGFEWGVMHRIFINSILPELAAECLRNVEL